MRGVMQRQAFVVVDTNDKALGALTPIVPGDALERAQHCFAASRPALGKRGDNFFSENSPEKNRQHNLVRSAFYLKRNVHAGTPPIIPLYQTSPNGLPCNPPGPNAALAVRTTVPSSLRSSTSTASRSSLNQS